MTQALLAVFTALLGPSDATGNGISISGGADGSGHFYAWTLTNSGKHSVTEVEFPHYHATLFFPPSGWLYECTGLVAVGFKDKPGMCIARADGLARLAPGKSAEFKMQIASMGARRGQGIVRMVLDDGSTIKLSGVEIAMQEPTSEKHIPLIGLGLIFFTAMAVRALRTRRAKESPVPPNLPYLS